MLLPLSNIFAQYTIKGTVIDSVTRKPLEYANVVNVTENSVVYTNVQGQFELIVNSKVDRIQVSNMGYKPYTLLELSDEQVVTVLLVETPIMIEEISVKKRKLEKHSEELGFHNEETISTNWGPGGQVANTYVVLIKNPQTIEAEIDKAYFKLGKYLIGRNGFSKARVRVMKIDSSGLPGNDLLRENNIVRINPFSQSFSIDLKKYHINFPKEGIFIGLEFFCQTVKKGSEHAFKSNCPTIASTKVRDYKARGESYYHYFDPIKKTWKWIGITNGELSKAFTFSIFKFGLRVNY
ncbi:hypothetical protein GCM10028817_40280 [Spirosoma pomorum]